MNPFWYLRHVTAEEGTRLRWLSGTTEERNAALVALVLCNRRGQPVFQDGAAVRRWLSSKQIQRYALAWLAYTKQENPAATRQAVERRIEQLRADPLARLRFLLGGVSIQYDRDMTEACAHLLLLEEEMAPDRDEINEAFDMARFERLKEGAND